MLKIDGAQRKCILRSNVNEQEKFKCKRENVYLVVVTVTAVLIRHEFQEGKWIMFALVNDVTLKWTINIFFFEKCGDN